MSSATADTYPESVGSCRPLTPPTPPPPHPSPPRVPRGAPVRRQLDAGAGSGSGGDVDDDDDDDFLIRAVDEIERAYNEAKRRAPPCVCGRGDCAVERDEQRDRWMYVCSSQPKCKHVSLCKQVDLHPETPPGSDPKLDNPCVINVPSTHVSPQAAVPTTPCKYTSQGAGTRAPVHVSPKGAFGTAAVKVSPRGPSYNDEWPICKCTAGKCKVLRVGNEDFYVCHIPKGQGACSHKVPLLDPVKEPPHTRDNNKHLKYSPVEKGAHGNNVVHVGDNNANGSANPAQPNGDEWPFDVINDEIVPTAHATTHAEIHKDSSSMLHQSIPMAKTPTKSPMTPCGTRSPMTPRPDDICYRCSEKEHWAPDCPKPSSPGACYNCGIVGHYIASCPEPRGFRKQQGLRKPDQS